MNRREILERLDKLRTDSEPGFRRELTAIANSLRELLDKPAMGGRARARKLSKKRRSEIARKAANARWAK